MRRMRTRTIRQAGSSGGRTSTRRTRRGSFEREGKIGKIKNRMLTKETWRTRAASGRWEAEDPAPPRLGCGTLRAGEANGDLQAKAVQDYRRKARGWLRRISAWPERRRSEIGRAHV